MFGKQRPSALITRIGLCVCLAAFSGACKSTDPRTQVMLIIDADEEARARASQLDVTFESRSEYDHIDGVPYTESFATNADAAPGWPFSIALLPRDNNARRLYRITATLFEGDEVIGLLRAHSGFVAQRTLELHLLFTGACLGVECSEQESCLYGDCFSAVVDARSLRELGSDLTSPTADGGIVTGTSGVETGSHSGVDAGASDAGAMSAPARPGSAAADGGSSMPDMMMSVTGNCGDGQRDDGEQCDTAIPQGSDGACPMDCPAGATCERPELVGSGCQTRCMAFPITAAMSGDGCCPPGANANSDMDCGSTCDNGMIEAGETCDPVASCPTEGSSCAGANACLIATVEGDAASCTANCVMQPIEVCMSGDGCCPSNCSHDTDTDCSASCGNGVIDMAAGELCEANSAQPCPASCDDGNPCTQDLSTGSASNCNLKCEHVAITLTIHRDGCCPPERGNANNDSDCEPSCGNRVVERGEFCDGFCPTQAMQCNDLNPCTREGLTGSECGVRCTYDLINVATNGDSCCPFGANATNDSDCNPVCGNLVIEQGEICDGNCPTSAASCADRDSCTADVLTGNGCQRRCENRRLTANLAGPDGCCPPGANAMTDSDCMPPAAVCGNGRVETGERCDPCTCVDDDPCTREVSTGSGCNATCEHQPIGPSLNGRDMCCPRGADSSTDSDCTNPPPAMCGNGVRDPGEICDPCPTSCDPPRNCMRFMLSGSRCTAVCEAIPITTPAPNDNCCPAGENSSTDNDCTNPPPAVCGNGMTEPGEDCDGRDCPSCEDGDACTIDMRINIPDACHPMCRYADVPPRLSGPDECCPDGAHSGNDSDCTNPPPARCGNGVVEPPNEECDRETPDCVGCRIVMPSDPPP